MSELTHFKAIIWSTRRNGDGSTRYVELMPEISGRPGDFGGGAPIPLTIPLDAPIALDQVVTVSVSSEAEPAP